MYSNTWSGITSTVSTKIWTYLFQNLNEDDVKKELLVLQEERHHYEMRAKVLVSFVLFKLLTFHLFCNDFFYSFSGLVFDSQRNLMYTVLVRSLMVFWLLCPLFFVCTLFYMNFVLFAGVFEKSSPGKTRSNSKINRNRGMMVWRVSPSWILSPQIWLKVQFKSLVQNYAKWWFWREIFSLPKCLNFGILGLNFIKKHCSGIGWSSNALCFLRN